MSQLGFVAEGAETRTKFDVDLSEGVSKKKTSPESSFKEIMSPGCEFKGIPCFLESQI